MSKDIKGNKITVEQSKQIINETLKTMDGEKFIGAVNQGETGDVFDVPKTVADAQAQEIKYRNAGNHRAAGQFTQGFLGTIAQKIIYHSITSANLDGDDMSFISRFRGENISFGNGKEYTFTHMSGHEKMDPEQFIPTKTTKSTVISQLNTFLGPDNQLNTNSSSFMEKFTTSIQIYATKEYMLSDTKLQEFVNTLRDSLVNGARQYVYNLIMKKLMDKVTTAKTSPNGLDFLKIQGTATNMFDSCIEICQHIRRLVKTGSKYQLIQTAGDSPENYVRASSYDRLLWIWSIENDELADRGIKSQLYQAKLWDPNNGKSISDSSVYCPGNKIELKDLTVDKTNNYPKDTGQQWIDNNTVVILENGALEYNVVWEKSESQYYTNNMTLQITYHLAGMLNFIKTMRGFVYSNNNLSTLP